MAVPWSRGTTDMLSGTTSSKAVVPAGTTEIFEILKISLWKVHILQFGTTRFWSGTTDFKLVVPAGTTDPILKKKHCMLYYLLKVDDFPKKQVFPGSFHFVVKNVVQKMTRNIFWVFQKKRHDVFFRLKNRYRKSFLNLENELENLKGKNSYLPGWEG